MFGGCIIPLGIAVYEILHVLRQAGATAALTLAVAVGVDVASFCCGVAMGPIVGVDFLHVRQFTNMSTGIASIGGAGTFDGIVLWCIVAAYVA